MKYSYFITFAACMGSTYVDLAIKDVKTLFKACEVTEADGRLFAFESPLNAVDALAAFNSMDWRLPARAWMMGGKA